jgi:hypothetical protein
MSISFSMGGKPRVGKLAVATRAAPAAASGGGGAVGGIGFSAGSSAAAGAGAAAAVTWVLGVLGVKRKGGVLAGGLRPALKVQMFQGSSSDEEGG